MIQVKEIEISVELLDCFDSGICPSLIISQKINVKCNFQCDELSQLLNKINAMAKNNI